MCGIVGYIGDKNVIPILIDGLKQLEYRGYDSAGVAFFDSSNSIEVIKKQGRVSVLEAECADKSGNCGIGHTRWATHGKPNDVNAHPHRCGDFVVVHNGIIENYAELKKQLVEEGETFESDTDSEIIVHLVKKYFTGSLISAVAETVKKLEGAFAIVAMCASCPDKLVVARRNAPIVIGKGVGECYIASDIIALAKQVESVYLVRDDNLAEVTKDDITFYDTKLHVIDLAKTEIDINPNSLDLGGNKSYMIKEIYEIPATIANTISNFYHNTDTEAFDKVVANVKRISIVACGTAYHSGIVGKYAIEQLARIPVEVDIASEFRYKGPILSKDTLVIAISQSGETADTLAAVKLAKEKQVPIAVITNVKTSSITDYADFVFPTLAGTEIGVAATKSYNGQLTVLYMLALKFAEIKQNIDIQEYKQKLLSTPILAEKVLSRCKKIQSVAKKFKKSHSTFFIGRRFDYAVALEGSLKLKEISYIHSEGYAAGELKHGTIALIEKKSLVVAIITDKQLLSKTINAVHEVKARGATIVAVTCFEQVKDDPNIDYAFMIPEIDDIFTPLLSVIPLQVFAYYSALALGHDPDKPRNLAKSVTVE